MTSRDPSPKSPAERELERIHDDGTNDLDQLHERELELEIELDHQLAKLISNYGLVSDLSSEEVLELAEYDTETLREWKREWVPDVSGQETARGT
jgi:hypothetical protein